MCEWTAKGWKLYSLGIDANEGYNTQHQNHFSSRQSDWYQVNDGRRT